MSLYPRKSILELKAYKPNFGKTTIKNLIRLSANENPLGCTPNISNLWKNPDLNRYQPQQSSSLIQSISNRFNTLSIVGLCK